MPVTPMLHTMANTMQMKDNRFLFKSIVIFGLLFLVYYVNGLPK